LLEEQIGALYSEAGRKVRIMTTPVTIASVRANSVRTLLVYCRGKFHDTRIVCDDLLNLSFQHCG
jgi:hypothetical protein